MSIVAILVVIAMMCAAIYLTAIYALPILAGLAAYSLLNQIDASAPTVPILSVASGFAAFVAVRAGAAARYDSVRLASLALIAAPAGYAAYCATVQLACLLFMSTEWSKLLAVIAAFAVAGCAIDAVIEPRRLAGLPPTENAIDTRVTPDTIHANAFPPALTRRARL